MHIAKDTKMGDVVHHNHSVLTVMLRFNIKLGFGDKTVDEVCSEYNINTSFFLEIINAFLDPNYFPSKHLRTFSVNLIIDYLLKTHYFYLTHKIPAIECMIEQLIKENQGESDLRLIRKFFKEYKDEFINHLKREDEAVFPYALRVETAAINGLNDTTLVKQMTKYSMNDYLNEHDNIEEKLFDLKNILIKYIPPISNQALCIHIIEELFSLEKDLHDHSRIEEKVLGPKVMEMEKQLLAHT
ncbi:MAG: hemerythrin domain-containing protein [Tenuifilaceae bacterium]|jgi:regulator of cell morphogenesis and NO signaling|nr:hemerythrin domain-containing protein [Tenuifilaceae bacterium]